MLLPDTSFAAILREEFESRRLRNGRYSLRSFARSLSISASLLSSVFNGRRSLGESTSKNVAERIATSREHLEYLYTIIQHDREDSTSRRAEIRTRLERMKLGQTPDFQLPMQLGSGLTTWYSHAILELIDVRGFRFELAWIAKRLNISVAQAESAISKLKSVGLIIDEEGVLKRNHSPFVHVGMPAFNLREFHRTCLEKAYRAIETQRPHQRKSRVLTLAFDPAKLEIVEKMTLNFLKEIASLSESSSKTAIYQMSVHFYQVDKP